MPRERTPNTIMDILIVVFSFTIVLGNVWLASYIYKNYTTLQSNVRELKMQIEQCEKRK